MNSNVIHEEKNKIARQFKVKINGTVRGEWRELIARNNKLKVNNIF